MTRLAGERDTAQWRRVRDGAGGRGARLGRAGTFQVIHAALTAPVAQRRYYRALGIHLHMPARALVYLWALPTTAVGLLAFALGAMGGRERVRYQVVDGVLEVYGGLVTPFLTHCTLLEGGASAMTLGHVVLGRDELMLDLTRDHERVHVRQCERWGALFLPAYLLASAVVFLRRGRPYEDNPFEREAFGLTAPRRARRPNL